MRLVDDSLVCAQLVHDDVHLMIWKAPLDAATLDRTKVIGTDLARTYPKGFWALNVIGSGITIPDVSLQRKSAEITKSFDTTLLGAAVVIPGEGFWVSAARSFLAGISMVSGARGRREVVATVGEGARWLATRSGRDVAWADSLVRELELSGALPATAA